MLSSYTSNERWSWRGVLDFLEHTEVAAVARCNKQWSSELSTIIRAGDAPRTLLLNGSPRCAARLASAAADPVLSSSLRALHFEFCNALQNFDLVPLSSFKHLTCLNLNACRNLTDSAIEVVAEKCTQLQRLELFWLVTLSDVAIAALAEAAFPPLLTHLNLSGLKHVTDATLAPLLRRCANLTFLDLTRCEAMRDEALRAVGETCHKLRTLLLYATPAFSDKGLEALAPGVPLLTHLDCTGNKLITDAGVRALALHCPALRVLMLQWCTPNLTDASLHALGEPPSAAACVAASVPVGRRDLRVLSLHGNINFTAAGMESLARSCTRIETMDINGCKNLGKYRNNLQELQHIFPKLQKLMTM
jgi:hypothetical protein